MTATQHLDWFEDNIDFFASIAADELRLPVPSCPPWTVLDLLNHLSFGLGACYPVAASAPPTSQPESIFTKLKPKKWRVKGKTAVGDFTTIMRTCGDALAQVDPDSPCWTYAGPGTASFWFLRAAAETALHRHDAELALGRTPTEIATDRVIDGIDEALEFALPFAASKVGAPNGSLTISCPDIELVRSIGTGEDHAAMEGAAQSVLLALWGRERGGIQFDGSHEVATGWLSLIENAFAGR